MKNDITFPVEIIREEDGKSYYAVVPNLPGCFSQGKTIEETKRNIAQAIILHLKEMKKSGQKIPRRIESYQTTIQVTS